MIKKLKLLLSLFLFLVLTSLVSYRVIGDTKQIKIEQFSIEHQNSLLSRIIEANIGDSFQEFLMNDSQSNNSTSINVAQNVTNKSNRLFCIILTSQKNYKVRTQTIYNAWASKCDEYRFITMVPPEIKNQLNGSNLTNKSVEFKYNDQKFLQPADLVHDQYDELTDKMYLTFRDINKRYGQFDWYLKADDDTFIFVDNLKKFLSEKNSSQPVTFGYNFKVIVKKGYHSGGAGYVLSRESLSRLGGKLAQDYNFCPNSGLISF